MSRRRCSVCPKKVAVNRDGTLRRHIGPEGRGCDGSRRAPLGVTLPEVPSFSEVRWWDTVGARVGLVTCLDCGAAIFIDPDAPMEESGRELHIAWHLEQQKETS